jgi:hypothetical protein
VYISVRWTYILGAVELELSGKTTEEYGAVLRWYGGALDDRRVRWFCARPAIRQRLAELVDRERIADFVAVEALPAGVTAHGGG